MKMGHGTCQAGWSSRATLFSGRSPLQEPLWMDICLNQLDSQFYFLVVKVTWVTQLERQLCDSGKVLVCTTN